MSESVVYFVGLLTIIGLAATGYSLYQSWLDLRAVVKGKVTGPIRAEAITELKADLAGMGIEVLLLVPIGISALLPRPMPMLARAILVWSLVGAIVVVALWRVDALISKLRRRRASP